MKTLPTVNTLQPILHNQLPVITTELLAQLYGTERQRLTNNFNRNKERFIEGKHFFRIEGKELRELKNKNSLRVPVRVVNEPSLRGLQIPRKFAPSSSGQNAGLHVTLKCLKLTKRGMCSNGWKTAISTRTHKRPRPLPSRQAMLVRLSIRSTPNRCITLRCATTSHSQPQPM